MIILHLDKSRMLFKFLVKMNSISLVYGIFSIMVNRHLMYFLDLFLALLSLIRNLRNHVLDLALLQIFILKHEILWFI